MTRPGKKRTVSISLAGTGPIDQEAYEQLHDQASELVEGLRRAGIDGVHFSFGPAEEHTPAPEAP